MCPAPQPMRLVQPPAAASSLSLSSLEVDAAEALISVSK